MSEALAARPSASGQDLSLEETAALIRKYDRILIVSHHRPDGDCLGSTVGLLLGLEVLGKTVAAYNASPLGDRWNFLEGIERVSNELPTFDVELTIFVDCGAVYRVSEEFRPIGATLNIDHHLTNDRFGDYNYIDIDCCAVGEQVAGLLAVLGVKLTASIASALYLSIMSDTGGFRYSNTTERAFNLAAELVSAGVEPGVISQAVFESRTKGEVAMTAIVYSSLKYEFDDFFVWGEIRKKDYEALGGEDNEPDGLASDIRGVVGVEVSCLFHEMPDGTLRAGFRGKGKVDCSAIAQTCGGGGHFNASGASIKGKPYEEAREYVLGVIRAEVLRTRN